MQLLSEKETTVKVGREHFLQQKFCISEMGQNVNYPITFSIYLGQAPICTLFSKLL